MAHAPIKQLLSCCPCRSPSATLLRSPAVDRHPSHRRDSWVADWGSVQLALSIGPISIEIGARAQGQSAPIFLRIGTRLAIRRQFPKPLLQLA